MNWICNCKWLTTGLLPVAGEKTVAVPDAAMEWESVSAGERQSVFAAELDAIGARRTRAPDALKKRLVGLAFSGGGIRSATFGLGVLEGLKEHGLLEKIDYLSTVSGGGYIGAWLSANCKGAMERRARLELAAKEAADRADVAAKKAQATVAPADISAAEETATNAAAAHTLAAAHRMAWLDKDKNWDDSIAHLRRYSNYLSPKVGFFSADTWSMAAIWLRNTLLVQLTVVFAIAFLLLVPRPVQELFVAWPHVGHLRWITVVIFIIAIAGIAGNQLRVSRARDIWLLEKRYWPQGLFAGACCALIAWKVGSAAGFEPFTNEKLTPGMMAVACGVAILLVIAGFLLLPFGAKVVEFFTAAGKKPPERINFTQAWVQSAVVLPMMATGCLVAAVLWGLTTSHPVLSRLDTYGGFLEEQWQYWPFPLYIALVSLWLLSHCSICVRKGNPREHALDTHGGPPAIAKRLALVLLAPIPATLVLYLLLCAIMLLLHGWAAETSSGEWLAFVWGPPLVLYAFTLAIVVLIGMLGRQSIESVREWWSRLGAWLAIYGVAWLAVAIAAVYGPQWTGALLGGDFWDNLPVTGGWLATTLGGMLAANSGSTGSRSNNTETRKSMAAKAMEVIAAVGPFVFIAGLLMLVSTAVHLIILSVSHVDWTFDLLDPRHWEYMNAQSLRLVIVALVATLAVTLLLGWRVDINEFSLNAFYRSRLNRCYLGAARFVPGERKPQNFTGFDEHDDFSMADLAQSPAGPLHIVNCALNLGGSSDLALHTRHSASFMITPYAAGSGYIALDSTGKRNPVGYRRTAEYGGQNGYPTLGQAISVSGAAASPNMGYHTSPPVAFLLTMFNARLGWWFPNPRRPSDRPSPGQSLKYLVAELFGTADDDSYFLNISDGGHFENLAVYELIRRKCRVIIASDAECDPKLHFEGLATLIRMCQVDHHAIIAIDAGQIRPAAGSEWSRNRCAVGTISYDDGTSGILIYLKASMTGHEDTAILQYKSTHPTFPHESTGNQFYGEDQFESYRNLGKEIALHTFMPVAPIRADLVTMADDLKNIMAPTLSNAAQFTEHSKSLIDLWTRLAANPDLKLLEENNAQALDAAWPTGTLPDKYRPVFYVCSQMIQLMENVYLDLDLDNTWDHIDNDGWRATFIKWAKLPAIRRTWAMSADTFGLRFRHFCNRRFGLPMKP